MLNIMFLIFVFICTVLFGVYFHVHCSFACILCTAGFYSWVMSWGWSTVLLRSSYTNRVSRGSSYSVYISYTGTERRFSDSKSVYYCEFLHCFLYQGMFKLFLQRNGNLQLKTKQFKETNTRISNSYLIRQCFWGFKSKNRLQK